MRDFLEIIFKRKWQILTIFICCTGFVFIGNYLVTPLYDSEARMLVRIGREVTLPPTAMTQPLNIFHSRAEQINSQIQILKSRYLVELTIGVLPKELLQASDRAPRSLLDWVRYFVKTPLTWIVKGGKWVLGTLGLIDKLSGAQEQVLYFQKNLGVERIKDTDVLQVTFRHPNPEFAQGFLTNFLEVFLKASNASQSSPGSMDFFGEQFTLARAELTKAEEEMAAFRGQWQIYDLRVQKENTAQELTRISSDLRTNQLEAAAITAKLERMAKASPASIESELPVEIRGDQGIIELLKSLGQLKVRQNQLGENISASHPDMVALQGEISRLRRDIQREARGMLESQIAALKTKEKDLLAQEQVLLNRAQTLDRKGIELSQFERRVEKLRKDYQTYAEKQEISRIDQVMDQKRLTSVSVVQPPLMPYQPTYPRKGLNLLLGLFVGATLSIIYAFTSEHFAGTINHAEDLAGQLGVPFVVAVPDLSPASKGTGGNSWPRPPWLSFKSRGLGAPGEKRG